MLVHKTKQASLLRVESSPYNMLTIYNISLRKSNLAAVFGKESGHSKLSSLRHRIAGKPYRVRVRGGDEKVTEGDGTVTN
ncbi:hypothetical protein K9N50_02860 [bacterium]|nr:hypothetical protein [bacterium]